MARRLGLKVAGRHWRGDCPCCGYPGAFVLSRGSTGAPVAWCSSCQDKTAIAATLRAAGGDTWTRPEQSARATEAGDPAARRERALAVWRGAAPIEANDPAALYLRRRAIGHLIGSAGLRFRPNCRHPECKPIPALIALVTDAAGEPLGIHRTFIDRTGAKACVTSQKASLGPVRGGAIRLDPFDSARPLVIGEGIESSASAGPLIGAPAWAALSCGNLERALLLPAAVRNVVIAADLDPPGEAAAIRAAWRWQVEGRTVRIARPTIIGDFNDLLMQRRATRETAHAR